MAIKKKVAALVATGVGLTVVGTGVAATTAFAEPTPTPPGNTSTSGPGSGFGGKGDGMRGGHRPGNQAMASELATKLGVDQAKVTEALQAVRQEMRTQKQQGTQRPDPATMETNLAKALAPKLGVDEAKVTTALQEIRAAHQAEHRQVLKTRLDQAVTDGKLTQAEADAVMKAAEAGVIGMGGGR